MKMSGEKILKAPQAKVWAALNDPEVLRQSIPGCESFQKQADDTYRATVAAKVGPVQARFNGTVRLTDLDPPNGYTISGEGSGGAAGSAKGGAKVRLEPADGGTRLSWTADAQISGKLAQIGSRLIESTANHMAGQFFDRFSQIIAGEEPRQASAADMVPAWVWLAGAASAVALAVILYVLLV
jgi:carbon monoxide dehydrogenase subunit G